MKHKTLIALFVLTIIGFIAFWPTFRLEIYGDEWEGIWWTTSTWIQTGHFNDRVGYKAYELAAILLNFVSGGFNLTYSSTQVYLFSFLTRLFAVFCLYYFLSRRGLSKIAVFIGCLLFLITPIGIQTTDWAKNFTSYISIGLLLLCIDAIYVITSWKRVIVFLVTFFFSVYINPIRSHGVIFTTIFLLIFQLLFQQKYKKLLVLSLLGTAMIFLILSNLSVFGDTKATQSLYISSFAYFFSQINLDKIGELVVLIGRGVLPDPTLATTFLLTTILIFWKRNIFTRKLLPIILIATFLLVAIVFMMDPLTKEKMTVLVGFIFIAFTMLAFFIEALNKRVTEAINTLIPLLLNVFFILIPYLLGRTDVTDYSHRYLIYSALSVPIIVSFALRDFNSKSFTKISLSGGLFVVSFTVVIVFYSALGNSINNLYNRHNQIIASTIWDQITPYFNNFDFKNRKAVVYFEGDDEGVLHDVVSFGFGYRMGFKYRIWNYDNLPFAVDSKKDLISLITDGKVSQKYVQKDIIFPKEDAFYFKIEKGRVVRISL